MYLFAIEMKQDKEWETLRVHDTIELYISDALKEGKALTKKQLTEVTQVSEVMIQFHLQAMKEAGSILEDAKNQFRLAMSVDKEAGASKLMANVDKSSNAIRTKGTDFKYCRSCYSHLAGKVGVMITNQLESHGYIRLVGDIYEVTPEGRRFFNQFHIDVIELQHKKKIFAKVCLDWSEKEFHLSGLLGTSFMNHMLSAGWMQKEAGSRVVSVTEKGKKELKRILDINL